MSKNTVVCVFIILLYFQLICPSSHEKCIVVKDYKWTETLKAIYIVVPLHGVDAWKVYVFMSEIYVKLDYTPYLFEVYLKYPTIESLSRCVFSDRNAYIELQKQQDGVWGVLQENLSEAEQQKVRVKAINDAHERSVQRMGERPSEANKRREKKIQFDPLDIWNMVSPHKNEPRAARRSVNDEERIAQRTRQFSNRLDTRRDRDTCAQQLDFASLIANDQQTPRSPTVRDRYPGRFVTQRDRGAEDNQLSFASLINQDQQTARRSTVYDQNPGRFVTQRNRGSTDRQLSFANLINQDQPPASDQDRYRFVTQRNRGSTDRQLSFANLISQEQPPASDQDRYRFVTQRDNRGSTENQLSFSSLINQDQQGAPSSTAYEAHWDQLVVQRGGGLQGGQSEPCQPVVNRNLNQIVTRRYVTDPQTDCGTLVAQHTIRQEQVSRVPCPENRSPYAQSTQANEEPGRKYCGPSKPCCKPSTLNSPDKDDNWIYLCDEDIPHRAEEKKRKMCTCCQKSVKQEDINNCQEITQIKPPKQHKCECKGRDCKCKNEGETTKTGCCGGPAQPKAKEPRRWGFLSSHKKSEPKKQKEKSSQGICTCCRKPTKECANQVAEDIYGRSTRTTGSQYSFADCPPCPPCTDIDLLNQGFLQLPMPDMECVDVTPARPQPFGFSTPTRRPPTSNEPPKLSKRKPTSNDCGSLPPLDFPEEQYLPVNNRETRLSSPRQQLIAQHPCPGSQSLVQRPHSQNMPQPAETQIGQYCPPRVFRRGNLLVTVGDMEVLIQNAVGNDVSYSEP